MAASAGDLARAASAARECGVTRLAELTQLDRLGVPVFHAVRPWSRALTVHQGKALTVAAAKIGALMEAVESDHAERFEAPVRRCGFNALPDGERAARSDDFGAARSPLADDQPTDWTAAQRLVDGGRLWAPMDVVSLDFTRRGDPRLDRSSNGLAAHFDRADAIRAALLEVIERDAVATWIASPIQARSTRRLAASSIPFPWFAELLERIRSAGLILSLYPLDPVVPAAAFLAELIELDAEGCARKVVSGSAADTSAEQALMGAVLEAVQSRATAIAGARDDLLYPSAGQPASGGLGLALPLPPHVRALEWDEAAPGDTPRRDLWDLLASAGYPQAAVVDLGRRGGDVFVVKVLVPGLGAFARTRRAPLRVPC